MKFELSLVDAGLVDPADFCRAIALQLAERPPLGQVAIEEGALSAPEVRDVLHAQRETHSDRFGEVAMDLGLLSRDKIARLLLGQSERERPLIDHLVDIGALTREDAEEALLDFRGEQSASGVAVLADRRDTAPAMA